MDSYQRSARTTVVDGTVPVGPFAFLLNKAASGGDSAAVPRYVFDGASATESGFDLTDVHLTVQHSHFRDCRFVQENRRANDGSWGQGTLGRRLSIFEGCSFTGVRFRLRAGFSVGQARFESCRFDRCRFDEHFSFCADYVACVFEGPIRKAVFYGRAPHGHFCDGKVNEFRDNDFTHATFRDVGFRGNIDPALQRWPPGFDPSQLMSSR